MLGRPLQGLQLRPCPGLAPSLPLSVRQACWPLGTPPPSHSPWFCKLAPTVLSRPWDSRLVGPGEVVPLLQRQGPSLCCQARLWHPCRGLGSRQPPTAVCKRRKRECGYSKPRDSPHPLVCDSFRDADQAWWGVGDRAPRSLRSLSGSCNHENT